MFGSDQCDFDKLTKNLGIDYEIMKIDFKPYPMCRWCQPAVEAGLEIIEKNNIGVNNIKKVVIKVAKQPTERPYSIVEPTNIEEAVFSLPYPFAVALCNVELGPLWYTEETMSDPGILNLSRKVKLVHDLEADKLFPKKCMATIEIYDNSGGKYSSFRETAKGDPNYPVTQEETEVKFFNLVSQVLNDLKAKDLLKILKGIEKEKDISNIKGLIKI